MSARGLRNNNPGNLRKGPQWLGLSPEQLDTDFAQFVDPEWGIRAMVLLLINYRKKRGMDTIKELVARYAPASENNCKAYEDVLCSALKVKRTDPINWTLVPVMRDLVKAIIFHENGSQPYSDKVIGEGMRRAGMTVPA